MDLETAGADADAMSSLAVLARGCQRGLAQ